jgi:multiple sugar transport system ATP-binding protein
MRTEIKDLHERLKTTTVYVTHDQIEAMTMADKIVILRDGVIEQQGSPLDVYDRPNNLFVASFIGSPAMNLIKGTMQKGVMVAGNGSRIKLPKGHKAKEGQEIVFGIRPEHLEVGQGVDIKISVTEPTGPEIHVYGDLGSDEICAVLRERVVFKRGEVASFTPVADKVHLFDAASGMVIR